MSLIVTHLGGGQTTADLTLQHFGSLLTGSGVLSSTAFTVSALDTPGMKVKVSGSSNADKAVIITDSGDTYFIKNTEDEEVTILANATGVTKTDAIVLYVDLTDGDPDNAGSPGAAKLIAVRHDAEGTGTGQPTDEEIDTATSNNPWIKLKPITVEHNTGEIESGDLVAEYTAPVSQIAKEVLEAIGADQIATDAVTTPKIKDGAVTTAKVASEAWSGWTPTFSGGGSMTVSSASITRARYKQVGRIVYFNLHANFTTSGTVNNTINFTLPVNSNSNGDVQPFAATVNDSGTEAGYGYINNSTQGSVQKNSGNWTLNTNRGIRVAGFYEAAP